MPFWHPGMMQRIKFRENSEESKKSPDEDFYYYHFEKNILQAAMDGVKNVGRYINSCTTVTEKLKFVNQIGSC